MKKKLNTDILLFFETRLEKLENFMLIKKIENKADESVNADLEKCKSALNKFETASLFYIFMDEGLLYFERADKRRNRSIFQSFICSHFTYAGDEGCQAKITSINKQFSECTGFTYREKQIRFLERLIVILAERKNRLAGW
ncbi:hypothetical protein [Flavobacterium sp. N502540]|uniref:hypothetical protein n=1 Tax=Flavobacterium sp. N502540 TaxID=2986838 RepID=UPI002224F618|nr:hypothetical protein [Flavobacterium sp. N502540]